MRKKQVPQPFGQNNLIEKAILVAIFPISFMVVTPLVNQKAGRLLYTVTTIILSISYGSAHAF